uniref:Putative secreted protein n=1 Tax=Anopheles triannulatus TaxID=58253 RepID=A0A2M4B4X6_9DIPT
MRHACFAPTVAIISMSWADLDAKPTVRGSPSSNGVHPGELEPLRGGTAIAETDGGRSEVRRGSDLGTIPRTRHEQQQLLGLRQLEEGGDLGNRQACD